LAVGGPIDGGLEGFVGNPAFDDEHGRIGRPVGAEEGVEAEAGEKDEGAERNKDGEEDEANPASATGKTGRGHVTSRG